MDTIVPEILRSLKDDEKVSHYSQLQSASMSGYARYATHLGNGLAIQTHHNATKRLIAMLDVEIDLTTLALTAVRSYHGQLPC